MKVRSASLIVLSAIVTGMGIAVWRIADVQNSGAFKQYGSWQGTTDLPLNRDNLLTTQVTLFALFALPSQEAVYLFATKDERNLILNGSNSYAIEGNTNYINATYWSITAYGSDQFLIPNEANRYSFNANTLQTDSAGNFKITVSPQRTGINWLPVKRNKGFRLVLRIYQGDKDFMNHLENARLPVIKKV